MWGDIRLTELLPLDKVHLHKNTTFSMYHFDLFIYFTIKLEGTAADNSPMGHLFE